MPHPSRSNPELEGAFEAWYNRPEVVHARDEVMKRMLTPGRGMPPRSQLHDDAIREAFIAGFEAGRKQIP
jgi:hypothetical protein